MFPDSDTVLLFKSFRLQQVFVPRTLFLYFIVKISSVSLKCESIQYILSINEKLPVFLKVRINLYGYVSLSVYNLQQTCLEKEKGSASTGTKQL